jgi:hypothetical protein
MAGLPPAPEYPVRAGTYASCQQATFEMKEAANLGGLGVEDDVSKSRSGLHRMTILMG